MDTNTGKVYSSLEEAVKEAENPKSVIEFDEVMLESNKLLMGTLRFLIKDNAFDTEFLLTTIVEYVCNSARDKKG